MPKLYINTKKGRRPFTVEDVFEVSAGRKASNGFSLPPKDGKTPRERLLERLTDEEGNPVSNTDLTNIFTKEMRQPNPVVEEPPEKLFPTLTDVANWTAEKVSRDTRATDDYYKSQVKRYEDLENNASSDEERNRYRGLKDRIEKLQNEWEDEKKTELSANNVGASGTFAPVSEFLEETVGDNIDLADVALAFMPVAGTAKAAGWAGRGLAKLPQVGKKTKTLAKFGEKAANVGESVESLALKHPVLYDMAEQTAFEGAHNFTDPTQSFEEAALGTALAGGTSGLVDAAGAWRMGRAMKTPEGERIAKLMKDANMPTRFSEFGEPVLATPAQRYTYMKNSTYPLRKELEKAGDVSYNDLVRITEEINEKFGKDKNIPAGLKKQFERPVHGKTGDEEGLSPWEESVWSKLGAAKDGKYSIKEVYDAIYSDIPVDKLGNIDIGKKAIVGRKGTYDPGVEAIEELGKRLGETNESALKLLEARKNQQWLRQQTYPEAPEDLSGLLARPLNAAANRFEGRLTPSGRFFGLPYATPSLADPVQDFGVGFTAKKATDDSYRPEATLMDVVSIPSEIWGMTTNKVSEAVSEATDRAVSEAMKKYIGK